MEETSLPSISVSRLTKNTYSSKSEDMSVCSEVGNSSVYWSEEESKLLEDQMTKLHITDSNLKSLFELSLLFPTKTIQQITSRVKWIAIKTTMSWEDYCENIKTSVVTQPIKISNHTSPRIKTEKCQRRSCHISPSRINEEKKKKRQSVPNGTTNTIVHKSEGEKMPSRNRRSLKQQIDPADIQKQEKKFVIPVSPKEKEKRKSSRMSQSYEVTEVSDFSVANSQTDVPQQSYTYVPNTLTQINAFVTENNTILNFMEACLFAGTKINPEYINTFGVNVQHLLELTDSLAQPMKLPFLQLVLAVPPSMVRNIQQN
ncbi:hypothetical protein EIN_118170 [Entamoeba invadens IP1]|uniref:Uncharacterized protein n=1 Tax=Entamoeba invadens IP1 TaxID=370355 RepID=L7FMT0_ENTIV|nr:hypothetical protein EIN_118170 [Entamoeba invadens IP1]ELP92243.1 hypothetical protein EIN_118170 [Entamoeba invadens IP1]|eukprot:XP_004259014.1 hypothetical protein EIN_118170 [Entamoeba invadens IP1]